MTLRKRVYWLEDPRVGVHPHVVALEGVLHSREGLVPTSWYTATSPEQAGSDRGFPGRPHRKNAAGLSERRVETPAESGPAVTRRVTTAVRNCIVGHGILLGFLWWTPPPCSDALERL
jgi:hypothetical protein